MEDHAIVLLDPFSVPVERYQLPAEKRIEWNPQQSIWQPYADSNECPLRHCADARGQPAPVKGHNVLPALTVKWLAMGYAHFFGQFDVFRRDWPGKVFFLEVLQSEKDRPIVHSPARSDVAEYAGGTGDTASVSSLFWSVS